MKSNEILIGIALWSMVLITNLLNAFHLLYEDSQWSCKPTNQWIWYGKSDNNT